MKNNLFSNRRQKVQLILSNQQATLVSSPSDIFYLTGFQFLVPQEREALLVITPKNSYLLHPSFSLLPDDKDLTLLASAHFSKLTSHFDIIQKKESIKQLLIDPQSLFLIEFQQLKQLNFQLKNQSPSIIYEQRIIKDSDEIKRIKKSCLISNKVLKRTKKIIKANISEIELKQAIEAEFKKNGVDQMAFPTIVAFGENTALPHHQPTDKKLKKDMPILIDMGAKVNGYCADMTRTFWYGDNPDSDFEKISASVRNAYNQAIKTINHTLKSGKRLEALNIDQSARSAIEEDGFGPYFIHTTGHGLGIDIHESPSINWQNQDQIKNNIIITIEPGIYLDGKFGFRYENTILIQNNKVIELT